MKSLIISTFLLFVFSAALHAQDEIALPRTDQIMTGTLAEDFFHQELDEKTEKQYLEALDNYLKAELLSVKELDERGYKRMLRDAYFRNFNYPFYSQRDREFRENDKKTMELEILTQTKSIKYRAASGSEKEQLKKELEQTLDQLFEMKENVKRIQIKEIEQELKEMKLSLQKRQENKNEIIRRRLQDLLGEADYLDWE